MIVLIGHIHHALLVRDDAVWKIEFRFLRCPISAAEVTGESGNGGDDPIRARNGDLPDSMVARIGYVKLAGAPADVRRKIESRLRVCSVDETVVQSNADLSG